MSADEGFGAWCFGLLNDTVNWIVNDGYGFVSHSWVEILGDPFKDLISWLDFSPFQLRLLREFSVILTGNVLFVLLAWRVYGPRISAKFARSGASRKVIEELRTSMSELQLPVEHDFKLR